MSGLPCIPVETWLIDIDSAVIALLIGVISPHFKLLGVHFCTLGVETYLPVISPEIADTLKMKSLVFQ